MPKTTNDNSGIINFSDKKKEIMSSTKDVEIKELSPEEQMLQNLDLFNEQVKAGAKSFVAIAFSENDSPFVVTAGALDIFRTMGVLDFTKTELSNYYMYGGQEQADEPSIEFTEDFPNSDE